MESTRKRKTRGQVRKEKDQSGWLSHSPLWFCNIDPKKKATVKIRENYARQAVMRITHPLFGFALDCMIEWHSASALRMVVAFCDKFLAA